MPQAKIVSEQELKRALAVVAARRFAERDRLVAFFSAEMVIGHPASSTAGQEKLRIYHCRRHLNTLQEVTLRS